MYVYMNVFIQCSIKRDIKQGKLYVNHTELTTCIHYLQLNKCITHLLIE